MLENYKLTIMKELSIEEKARAYDEALERAKKWYNAPNIDKMPTYGNRVIEEIFPELKESEDEKVRKTLVELVKCNERSGHFLINNVTTSSMLAWLEKQNSNVDNANKEYWRGYHEGKQEILDKYAELKKQDEQKLLDEMITPEESLGIDSETYNKIVDECIYGDDKQNPTWREEDEHRINRLIAYFEDKESFTAEDDIVYANWLKSLKDRTIPQPKQEWSKEDENILEDIEEAIINYWHGDTQDILLDWLKSLNPQSHWKPSEKQMRALHDLNLTGNISYAGQGQVLINLYNDLKKLKGE